MPTRLFDFRTEAKSTAQHVWDSQSYLRHFEGCLGVFHLNVNNKESKSLPLFNIIYLFSSSLLFITSFFQWCYTILLFFVEERFIILLNKSLFITFIQRIIIIYFQLPNIFFFFRWEICAMNISTNLLEPRLNLTRSLLSHSMLWEAASKWVWSLQ